jgi:hypothetical protein
MNIIGKMSIVDETFHYFLKELPPSGLIRNFKMFSWPRLKINYDFHTSPEFMETLMQEAKEPKELEKRTMIQFAFERPEWV